ncbi:hypothetical protein BST61_g10835 [Cercospora zeina]
MAKNLPPQKGVAYKPIKKNKNIDLPSADIDAVKASSPLPTMGSESDDDNEDDMPLTASNVSLINRKHKRGTAKASAAPIEKAKQARVSGPVPRARSSQRQTSTKSYGPDDAPTKEAMYRAMRQGPKAGLRQWSDAEKRDFCMVHLPAYFGTATMKTSPCQIDQWIESWWNAHGKQLWARIKKREREGVSSASDSGDARSSTGDVLKMKKGGKAPQAATNSVISSQITLSSLFDMGKIPKKRKASAGEEDEMPPPRSTKKERTGANEANANLSLPMDVAADVPASALQAASHGIGMPLSEPNHISKDSEKAALLGVKQGNVPRSHLSGREAIALAEKQNREARKAAALQASAIQRVKVDNEVAKGLIEADQVPKVEVPSFGAYNVLESLGAGK